MHDIYKLDETGCTTAPQPGGVVAPTEKKRIGSVTSAERGELVTVLYAVGASGVVVQCHQCLSFPGLIFEIILLLVSH